MNLTATPVLTVDELLAITGYQRPGDQLSELHRQGFLGHAARRSAGASFLSGRTSMRSAPAPIRQVIRRSAYRK